MARGNSDPGQSDSGVHRPAGAAPPEPTKGDPAHGGVPAAGGPASGDPGVQEPGAGDQPAPAAAPQEPEPPRRERGRERGGGFPLTFLRVVSLFGVLGIAVAIGAILAGQDVQGWLTALIVSALSIILTIVALVMRP